MRTALGHAGLAGMAGLVIFLAALVWLAGSESGLRFLCSSLQRLSHQRLQIEAPAGRLLGDFRAQALRWHDATREIEVRALSVTWSPRALLEGALDFERVEAASLRVYFAASDAPTALPETLRLPLAVRVDQLFVGRVLLAKTEENALPLAANVAAGLSSDGRSHRLERLAAQVGRLSLSASATLAADRPFALTAEALLQGSALDQPFELKLAGSGPIAELQVDGELAGGEASALAAGEVHATLTPFAEQAVAALRVALSGVDPALLADGLPHARLDVDAQLERQPGAVREAAPSGRLLIRNRLAGSLDRGRLPLESLHTQLIWQEQDQRLHLAGLELALAGGGRLKGQGRFAGTQLDLDLAAQALNARTLHADLPQTRLAGALRAQLGGETQAVEIELRDARYALAAQASHSQQAIKLERLQLSSGEARLFAQGSLALQGERLFVAQGRLENFDPARFIQSKGAPRLVLSAAFAGQGALTPMLQLAANFVLHDSRIGTQPLAGKGEIDMRGSDLRKIDLELTAAGNRLSALGAFGQPGETLRVKLLAPRLEAIGLADIAGDANADIVVGGKAAAPEFSGNAQASRLRVGRLLDVRDLAVDAQLGSGAQGKLAGVLRCTACALPAYGIAPLALELQIDGLRSRHHLAVQASLPQQHALRLALDGGLQDAAPGSVPALAWSGSLSELAVRKTGPAPVALVQLTAPAPLRVDSASLSFGPARLEGLIGSLQLERLALDQGRWQSAGRWQDFSPLVVLAEFPALAPDLAALGKSQAQAPVLGAEWAMASATTGPASGRVALWRERGDLMLGTLPLGLSEARLEASLADGRLAAKLQLRGTLLGEIGAELNALAARGAENGAKSGAAALLDTQAPWQGSLHAQIPDLSWVGPLIGEGWQAAGQVNGQMQLSGSPARPQWRGQWRGEKLALRELGQGMRLERGEALIEIDPERLSLRRLFFESDFQPLPRVLQLDDRIDAARLAGRPGRLEASGELALGAASASRAARLDFKLDRIGVTQRPDQWVAVSGDGQLQLVKNVLEIAGKLRADAGFWSLAELGRPQLSSDVLIKQPAAKGGTAAGVAARPARAAVHLDLDAAFGDSFHFRGAGVESRLAGQIRIRSDDAGLPRASGSIRTVGGRFDAYGQKLAIERGILNFQGPIDNPGLNLLAVRKNLPVEAGVEVTGTAQRPLIRLVSNPEVPDTEKLSWLVLGRSPEQQGGDSAILLAAAQGIFGGQSGGVLTQLQQGLGIDEFNVSSGEIGSPSRMPTSRVASSSGFGGGGQTVSGQIVSVGKRLSTNALLSYEQSLSNAESVVKLTVNLNRQFSVVGSAGSESALDFFWHYSFGR